MSICIRCKQEFESEHSDYVCDDCHLLSIRKRIDGNTSYPTHIADLRFLMKRYDEERAAHNEHMTELCQLEKENRKLREQLQRTVELYQFECRRREEETEERDKLVEALRWYADQKNYEVKDISGRSFRLTISAIDKDYGQRASDTLKELGRA